MTATIIGVVQIEGDEQHNNQLEVGVFHGTECRGTGMASTVVSDRCYVFLSVFGLNGEEDTFKIYDHATDAELDMTCTQTFVYQDNNATGTIPAPFVLNFLYNHFEIKVSANPTTSGVVTGGGTYDRGATVNLNATPNEGSVFEKWTKDDVQVSTSAAYSFTATKDTEGEYVAQFQTATYTITVAANPTTGGTVSGGGTYTHGASATLTATPNTGYIFVNWTKGGTQVSTEASYTFPVTEAGDYVANFSLNTYAITVAANPTAGGTVSGGGNYYHGANATLTATPNTGYTFVNWTKGGTQVSTSASYTFPVTEAGDYVANFSLNSYAITVAANPTAGGTVTGGGTYNYGANATLTATPNTGYTFVNWTKGGTQVSTEASYTFPVTEAGDYVANFSLNSYEITVAANPTAGGTVSGGGTYDHGAEATLTATPNTGYTFVNWTKGGTQVSTSASYTFPVTEAGDYVANFSLNSYEITVVANPTAGGTVLGGGTYNHGAEATLTATPNTGYTFVNWTKGGTQVSTSASYTFSVTEAGDYVANFTLNSYEVTATADPVSGGTITGAGTYNHGETCTLVATPNTGCNFVNWTKDGTQVSTETTYSFAVTEAGDYVAHFTLIGYEIAAVANPVEGGTVTGAGAYNYGQECTLTASANDGYTFVQWTKDGADYSTDMSITFTVEGSASFEAIFSLNSYAIAVAADPTEGGSVTGGATYNHGETANLVATPNEGYTFVNWTKGGAEVSTEATYSFTVTEAGDYVAHFSLNSYAITVAADPTTGGTVTGGGSYNHGVTATLTATAAEGYTFINWTKGGTEVSAEASFSFPVTEAGDYVAHFSLNSYEITATADPISGGTITGAGTYNHGETCTLTATPNTGSSFVKWTKDGADYSTETSISFPVTAAASFVAHFTLIGYEVSATASPAEGGTITGMGGYDYGTTATLTATANPGYTFVNWTQGGTVVSDNPTYAFEVTGTVALVANFSINSYVITASVNPTEGGTVTGAGTYNHGETVTLTATAATGYAFVKWTKGGVEVSTNPTISFTVEGAASYVAHFIQNTFEVTATANPTVGGTITGAGTYNHGETATLTATAATGYTFVNWTKGGTVVSTNPSYSFEVTEAVALVANFSLNSYVITATANPTAGGTITGTGTYNHGETATLTATAATGYTFVNWTKGGTVVSTNPSYSFEVTEAVALVANFSLNSYVITATANPTIGGTITGAGTYNHGETATLTATAATGYTFVNWTKGGTVVSTNPSYSFEVTAAATLVANFSLNSYAITATANPTAGGTITGTGTYNHGETATLTATAATGYTFVNWTQGGTVVSTNPSYSFEVTAAATLVANFSLNSYAITATANPTAGGTITGTGTYNHGETATLTATAATGYTFVNWTQGGTVVSTNPSYSFEVTEAVALVANFSLNSYVITATANPTIGGTITGAGTYNHGETATLTATAATGYTFVNWTKDGAVVSTNPSYSFEVTAAATLVANFSLNSYVITATADPATFGTVTGGGTYNHFESCTLTATPANNYYFINWTKNGVEVSTSQTYTFTVTEGGEYVAHFSPGYVDIVAYASQADFGTVEGGGSYLVGSTCTLTAIPFEGFIFSKWAKGTQVVSTDAVYSFEVTDGGTYRALFEREPYYITAEANPAEGGTITGTGGTFYNNTTCQLIATANEGYNFVNWTKDGAVVSTNYIYEFAVTGSAHYVANFELVAPQPETVEITAEADPAEGGSVMGAGTYQVGDIVVMMATANTDYRFVNWTVNNQVISESEAIAFIAEMDLHLVAHFVSTVGVDDLVELPISVYPNPTVDRLLVDSPMPIRQCEVYSITGQRLLVLEDCGENFEIQVRHLPAGSYLLRLTSDHAVQVREFIKK